MPSKTLVKLEEDDVVRNQSAPAVAGGQQNRMQLVHPPRESRIRLKWEDRLEQLKAFKAKHGHVDVPRSYAKDPSLGTFVCNQRQTYKRMNEGKGPSMDRSRIQQMNALGFKWVLKHKDQPILFDTDNGSESGTKPAARAARAPKPKPLCWEEGMAQLKEFKLANGHTDVPHIYAANQPLGNFVKSIRQNYKSMQKGKDAKLLNEPRINDLERMGFKLQVRQREPWEQRFKELRQHVQKHGNCEVPKHTPLGIWILNQRSQFKLMLKKKPSHMSEERINLLNSIGFDWRVPMQDGMKVSGQVYVYNGRAYAPSVDSRNPSLPSDQALASARVSSQMLAAPLTSDDEPNDDREKTNLEELQNNGSFSSLGDNSTGMQPNNQATASIVANQGFATAGFLGFGMHPMQHYASALASQKPAAAARSVSDDSSSYADYTKQSTVEDVFGQSFMLPELAPLPLPIPIPTLSAPIRIGASSMMMPSLSFDQYLAKAPAPAALPRVTADMFVDSLLNDDIGMGKNPFASEELKSGTTSDGDEDGGGDGDDEVQSFQI